VEGGGDAPASGMAGRVLSEEAKASRGEEVGEREREGQITHKKLLQVDPGGN
jgi:hypothetical protein